MIDEKFIEKIPENFNQGTKFILDEYFKQFPPGGSIDLNNHDSYLNYWGLLDAYLKNHKYKFTELTLNENLVENIQKIDSFFKTIKQEFSIRLTHDLISDTKEKYDLVFKNSFSYEFTEGDLNKMQQLINELRDIITQSDLFTAEHQQRILKKLEKLQGELHKKVSDLDRFWGLIGDAGIAIGKFGLDAKPFVDRIREIADIVWRTQSKAEELPSGFKIPLLTDKMDNE